MLYMQMRPVSGRWDAGSLLFWGMVSRWKVWKERVLESAKNRLLFILSLVPLLLSNTAPAPPPPPLSVPLATPVCTCERFQTLCPSAFTFALIAFHRMITGVQKENLHSFQASNLFSSSCGRAPGNVLPSATKKQHVWKTAEHQQETHSALIVYYAFKWQCFKKIDKETADLWKYCCCWRVTWIPQLIPFELKLHSLMFCSFHISVHLVVQYVFGKDWRGLIEILFWKG